MVGWLQYFGHLIAQFLLFQRLLLDAASPASHLLGWRLGLFWTHRPSNQSMLSQSLHRQGMCHHWSLVLQTVAHRLHLQSQWLRYQKYHRPSHIQQPCYRLAFCPYRKQVPQQLVRWWYVLHQDRRFYRHLWWLDAVSRWSKQVRLRPLLLLFRPNSLLLFFSFFSRFQQKPVVALVFYRLLLPKHHRYPLWRFCMAPYRCLFVPLCHQNDDQSDV